LLCWNYKNAYKKKKIEKSSSDTKMDEGSKYSAGMKVKHKVFGNGTVIDSEKGVLTIAFEGKGIKKLMAGVVPIEIVG